MSNSSAPAVDSALFDIRVLSERDEAGERFGRITIGEFSEKFGCCDAHMAVDDFEREWKRRLNLLVQTEGAVALVHDPRFAWIVYRDGGACFVQHRLAIDGVFDPIPPRRTMNEEGHRISEWWTNVGAIVAFLAK